MQYIGGLEEYRDLRKSAVTFGKFDGLHRGHQKLIQKVKELGEKEKISSVVCSFDMKSNELLMSKREKIDYLEGQVDYLVDCPFSNQLRHVEAEQFIREIIHGVFRARYVVVGSDFRFGYGKVGDAQMLKQNEKKYGYETLIIEKERYGDRVISSTYVRESMREGNVALANTLLGYSFGVDGIVGHGKQLGRTLGFPTLNVVWPEDKVVPPRGVYLSRILLDGNWYNAISNIGVKPTVSSENKVLIESFLFEYDGNAYGEDIIIHLLEYCRPEQKFSGIDEMKACIDRDIEDGKRFFGIER